MQVLVTRQSPAGEIAAGSFLVDLGCLGVKDAFARLFPSWTEYEHTMRYEMLSIQPLVSADLNLSAKIIREGIDYARRLGFNPHRDYNEAAILLAGADPDASAAHVPLGKDGKPFYVSGPYDDARRIVAQLERAVGTGNFHYVVALDAPPNFSD